RGNTCPAPPPGEHAGRWTSTVAGSRASGVPRRVPAPRPRREAREHADPGGSAALLLAPAGPFLPGEERRMQVLPRPFRVAWFAMAAPPVQRVPTVQPGRGDPARAARPRD